ncbi:MAG: lysozyme [Candidatus Contendobacter sp.]|jgi:lysozyme|nr:lysozyme [Candidatus Contendobacter sp.]
MADKALFLAAEFVKPFEAGPQGGFARVAYFCPAGKQTVGWGHVIRGNERIQTPLSEEAAEGILYRDLMQAYETVLVLVDVPLTDSMIAALTSFTFNLGGNALSASTLLKKLNAGNYRAAADELPRWNKARDPKTGQVRALAGLTRRRKAERELFLREGIPG